MRTKAIIIGAVVAVLLVAIIIYKYATRQIELPPILPPGNLPGQIDHVFGAKPSQLVATVRLPFAKIKELVAQKVPRGFHDPINPPDQGGFSGIHVHPNVSIDLVQLTPEVNSAGPAKVRFTFALHGSAEVKAFKWIIVRALGATLKTKSPEVTETVNIAAQISGWISPGIDGGWNLTHSEDLRVTVSTADVRILFGIIHISLKDEIEKLLKSNAPGVIKQALDSIRDQMPIRPEVAKVWNQMFAPVGIASNPAAFMLAKPEKVHLQNIAFDDPNVLTIRIAIDGHVQTAILASPPAPPPPTSLPPLVFDKHLGPKFHVVLPVGVQLSALAPTLQRQLTNRSFDLDDGTTVELHNLTLYSSGSHLYVKTQIEASHAGFWRAVKGTIYLKSALTYDQNAKRLQLKDVDFSVETHNILAQVASWLLRSKICHEIEKQATLDMPVTLERLREEANHRLAAVQVSPGINLKAHLDTIKFEGVEVQNDLVIVGFDLSGEVSCDSKVP